jgi:hypothetical protein
VTVTVTATVTTTVVGITGTATTDATLSPSAATTDLSVEFGAATKYHRRTTARAVRHPARRALAVACVIIHLTIGLLGSLPNEGVNINGKHLVV